MPAATFTDENLFCVAVARMASLSVEHGNSDASCHAYVWLDKNVVETGKGDYYARNLADFGGSQTVQHAISSVVTQVRLEDRGVPANQIERLLKSVNLRTIKVSIRS